MPIFFPQMLEISWRQRLPLSSQKMSRREEKSSVYAVDPFDIVIVNAVAWPCNLHYQFTLSASPGPPGPVGNTWHEHLKHTSSKARNKCTEK